MEQLHTETLDQYYGGQVPEIDQVSIIDRDEKLDIMTIRWREKVGRKVVTVKSMPSEQGRIITILQ